MAPDTDRQPVVLIITGLPASGKSRLGQQLAWKLALPFFGKDVFKQILFDDLGWSDRESSRRLGAANIDLLFRSASALLEVGKSVARFVQVVCTASRSTLEERYRRRSTSSERHPGHTESEQVDETLKRLLTGRWEALALDYPVISVETETLPTATIVDTIVWQVRHAMDAGSARR